MKIIRREEAMTKPNRRGVIEMRQAKRNDLIKAISELKSSLANNIESQNWAAVNSSAVQIEIISDRLRQI